LKGLFAKRTLSVDNISTAISYEQGQKIGKVREYFYFMDHHGQVYEKKLTKESHNKQNYLLLNYL
jgi:hypothetical protein